MEEKDDNPFDREPWKRLLADPADAPPETTDARIRKAARRDLAPRGRRWWLPASLAASFVLAVFVVQSQFGTLRVPVTRESDSGAGGAVDARIIDREEAKEAREPGRSASARSDRATPAAEPLQEEQFGHEDSELAADSAGTGPMVGGPERELKAASEMPDDLPPAAAAAAPTEPGFVRSPEVDLSNVAVSREEAADEALAESRAATPARTPEVWYSEIEKLRAAGRIEEADRELERLKKAYPGWLEQYLEKRSER
jgi:hypothetical protein